MVNLVNLTKTFDFSYLITRVGKESIMFYNSTGISCDNEYIPLFAPFVNKGVYSKKIVCYSLPKVTNFSSHIEHPLKTYNTLYDNLRSSSVTKVFKTASMDFEVIVIKGALFLKLDENNVELLFSVGVKEGYMTKMFKEEKLDNSQFAMLISQKFASDPKFKRMYSKMYKEIMVPHLEKGVDIITTNNIVGKCFNNKVQVPKFKRISEVKEYLHAFNSEINE